MADRDAIDPLHGSSPPDTTVQPANAVRSLQCRLIIHADMWSESEWSESDRVRDAVMVSEVLVITWFNHRRTESLCGRLGWTYLVIDTRQKGIIRYLLLAPRTIRALFRARPRVLVVQNPSLILAALCVLLRPIFRYRLIIDAHNEAVQPFVFQNIAIRWISRECLRSADLTIITNDALARIVCAAGGRPFVLPDPLPIPPPPSQPAQRHQGFHVAVISTFAKDEPLEKIVGAALRLQGSARFYVTGNLRRLVPEVEKRAPANVTFTGFLSEERYWDLLRNCDVIIDLTTKPDCLVCGAYEAIAVMKPLILTDSLAARTWFADAATYVQNEEGSIAQAILDIKQDVELWMQRTVSARPRIEQAWNERSAALLAYLAQ